MQQPGILGVGKGLVDGQACITIFSLSTLSHAELKLPESVHGIPVIIKQTTDIKAL